MTRHHMLSRLAAVTAAVFSALVLIGGIAHAQTTPTLTASPSTVAAGSLVTFTGTGFNPSETITLSSSGTGTSIASATSDTTGAFSVSWTVPAGTAVGTYTIAATDQSSRSATATLTVTGSAAPLYVSPSTINAGDPVTFTGSGFNPSQIVTLSSSFGAITSATSDANGAFAAAYTMATTTPPGTYTVTAVDQSGRTASTTLVVNQPAAAYVPPPATYAPPPVIASPLPATPVGQAVPSASGQVAFTGASTKSQSYTGLAAVAAGLLLLVIGRVARSRART